MNRTIMAIIAVFVIGLVATGVYAFRGNEEMKTALETQDYDAYVAAFDSNDQGFMRHQITEEEFNQRADRFQERMAHHEVMEEAMESGSYGKWLAAVSEQDPQPHMVELITEDNFDTFVAMHNAMEAGDYETAKELRTELGIEGKGPGNSGKKEGRGNGFGISGKQGCMR